MCKVQGEKTSKASKVEILSESDDEQRSQFIVVQSCGIDGSSSPPQEAFKIIRFEESCLVRVML